MSEQKSIAGTVVVSVPDSNQDGPTENDYLIGYYFHVNLCEKER